MVFGVGVIFFLMLRQKEGLEKATRSVANMMPPEHGEVPPRLETAVKPERDFEKRDEAGSFRR